MGFLDNVKKGLDNAASQINQAVSNTQQPQGSPPPPGTAGAPPPPGAVESNPYGDDSFIDGFHPETWIDGTGMTIEELLSTEVPLNIVFEGPQTFETDDAYVARYPDHANGFTLDLASVKEELLGRLGTQEAVCAHYAGQLVQSSEAMMGDLAIQGSNGPGHWEMVTCIGDLVAKCDLYGPAELDLDGAKIGVYELLAYALQLNQ